tara:strand:+ start:19 stop:153 length:135 start_codon:yes stop_codon:yes gene_type:complete
LRSSSLSRTNESDEASNLKLARLEIEKIKAKEKTDKNIFGEDVI